MSESTSVAARMEAPPPAPVSAGGLVRDVGGLLEAIMSLARNPEIDAEKLREVRLTVNEARASAKEEEFARDKAAACRAMPVIRKDGRIVIAGKNGEPDRVQGHFERWPDVQRAITPHLVANHLTLTHRVEGEDGRIIVTAILRHDNGFTEESGKMPLPLDTSGGKNNVQGSGSAQSYGQRYSTRAILGLQFEPGHDDGDLIALPDEPLNDQQQRRVAEAEALFSADPQQFEDWWNKQQPQDKAWMIQSGRYQQITGKSGGLLAAPVPRKEPVVTAKGHDVSTPEGWTAQYEDDCRAAATLDALAEVQRKGRNAMGKLKTGGLTDLHDRAIQAGGDAYSRLSATDGEEG